MRDVLAERYPDRVLPARLVRVAALPGPVDFAARLPVGAAVATPDGSVTLWEPGTRRSALRLDGHGGRVTAVVKVSWLTVTASEDGAVRTWLSGAQAPVTRTGHRGLVRCISLTPAGALISGDDGCLILWDTLSNEALRWPAHEAAVRCLDVAPDGTAISGAADGRVATWHTRTGATAVLGGHNGPVRGLAVLRDGLVATWGRAVRFWRPGSADPVVGTAAGFPGGVVSLVAGEQTYTVLCGDGSVQRRLLPDPTAGQAREHPDRGCLTVWWCRSRSLRRGRWC